MPNAEQSPLFSNNLSSSLIRPKTSIVVILATLSSISGLYWFRSLVYPQRDDYNRLQWNADDWRNACVDIPEGASYYEKNAYLFYEWTQETKFEPIDTLWFKLELEKVFHYILI